MSARWKRGGKLLALLVCWCAALSGRALARGQDPLLSRLLAWASPQGSTIVYDRRCRAIYVVRRGDVLMGHVNWDIQIEGNTKSVSALLVSFGRSVIRYNVDHWEYERSSGGKWIPVSGSGYSDFTPSNRQLSRVTDNEAWYDLVFVQSKEGRRLMKEGPTHPYVFRTLQACREYRSAHKLRRDELEVG